MTQAAPPGSQGQPFFNPSAKTIAPSMSDLIDPSVLLDSGPHSHDYDALADLFLGQPGPTSSPAPTPPGRPPAPAGPVRIEGLIVGHLPVLGAAWASQYARHLAASIGGPVAMVRIRSGHATVDLYGDAPETATASTLDDAVRTAGESARAWVIRVDETSEPRLIELAGLDAATLLTGADEAAIVASYKTIKRLFHPGDGEDRAPDIRLAIMGAAPDRAASAAAKLQQAAQAFLDRNLAVTACVSRIGAGRMTTVYRGPSRGEAEQVLTRIVPLMRNATPRQRPLAMNSPVIPLARPSLAPSADAAPPVPPVAPRAAPVSRLGHASAAESASSGPLALHLSGLTPLQAMCPHVHGVELAVDALGGLHLITGGPDAPDAAEAVSRLITACAWATPHLPLLRLAAAADGAKLDQACRPILHLLTGDAKSVRRFGDAEVRLHLLARTEVAGRQGWFCTDLN